MNKQEIPRREELPPPEKLRANQVAQRYSIGLSTVWALSKQKKLTAIKVTDKITVFDRKECDEFFSTGISA